VRRLKTTSKWMEKEGDKENKEINKEKMGQKGGK
jgi:hypothetical protein